MSCLAANVCVLKKPLFLFGRENVAHWDSATVFFQGKSKMYFLNFIGVELSGEKDQHFCCKVLKTIHLEIL